MKILRNAVISDKYPQNKELLWIDTSDKNSVAIKVFIDGQWKSMSSNNDKIDEMEQSLNNIIALIGTSEDELDDTIDKYIEIVNFLNGVEETTLNDILAKFVRSQDVRQITVLTQNEYDTLPAKNNNTEYNIIEE